MKDVRLTHIGGPTVLIEVAGWRLLTDPTFDPPGRRYSFGWGTSSRKLTGPAMAASELPPIDAVLLSHDHHGDNLDDAGRALLASASEVATTVPGARRLGGHARGLEPWETTRLESPGKPTIEVTATPCRHGPPLSRPLAGHVVGFALCWEGQEQGALWISGDTVLYDGVRQVANRIAVDTALLHLGGVRFPVTGPLRYSMTARQAIELCSLIRPRTVIPVHYEGWKHFQESREKIERELSAAPEDIRHTVRWLPLGIAVELAAHADIA
jgi:L-ascorbate metabolism protein UlaG (beta-lactamase superfamily)